MASYTLGVYYGQVATKQTVSDLSKRTNSRSALGLINTSLGAFNAVVNTARKFQKNTSMYPQDFIIYNNTIHPIVVEETDFPNCRIVDRVTSICPGESKVIKTFSGSERDNQYNFIFRVGHGSKGYRIALNYKNWYEEYTDSNQTNSLGLLGLDKASFFAGSSTDESTPLKSTTLDRDTHDSGGYVYHAAHAYLSFRSPDFPDYDLGITSPLVNHNATETFISFHSI